MAARKQPKKDQTPERDTLHRLVDALPAEETSAAELFLAYLKGGRADPVLFALATAPWDDEPESEEERLAVEEAKEELARGEVRSWTSDELRRELGI